MQAYLTIFLHLLFTFGYKYEKVLPLLCCVCIIILYLVL